MKYKAIIADDEKKIIQLIKQLGHWEHYGIELIDECKNGKEALDSIQQHNPDFVLSDIKMPIIDGIELIQFTQKQNMDTLFILLSGYRHFEYARSAIQLSVVDYLLKPIDELQLNDTLENVCRRVDQLREQKKNNEKLLLLKEEQVQSELMQFWNLLTQRQFDENRKYTSITLFNNRYKTDFQWDSFQVLCIVSNLNGMLAQNDSVFNEKIKGYLSNCFREIAQVHYYATYKGHIVVLNFKSENREMIKNATSILYYSIRDLNEIYGNFRLNIGCSTIKVCCSELVQAFTEASASEWGRLLFLGNNIIEYHQIAQMPSFRITEVMEQNEIHRICDSIRFLREEEFADIMERLYKLAHSYNNSNPGSMVAFFYEFYEIILPCVQEEAITNGRFFENYYYAYLEARNFQQVIKNMFIMLNKYILGEQEKLREKLGKPLVEAVKFIKENYKNPISQEDVAKASNVSTTYLSKLFKEEMKMGFNEFLTQMRMDESKELLSETNYSIKEIASKVGYFDEKYYSKLFKKVIGIKPTEYRRLYG